MYKDKNGQTIQAGMKMKHDEGEIEEVFTNGEDLGFNAVNPEYAKNHPEHYLFEIYPLTEFFMSEWEIVKE